MPVPAASATPASKDPLLQPYRLKHLTLKNRLISTAHEPAYSEDGLPKDRYRLYHLEKAKGGIALTMTAGSAIVAEDSPPAFGNLHAYKDEIVPWLKRLADDCHEEGCAVMIQLTHLGRRTNWNKADWLPVAAPSLVREPAHRAFPKEAELWDIERWIGQYADAAERMKAAGLDGIELECYGHLIDQFWSKRTNKRTDDYGGSLENRLRFTLEVMDAIRKRVGPDFIMGLRLVLDEALPDGIDKAEGLAIAKRLVGTGQVDFLNVIRGAIDTDALLAKVIPVAGMKAAPHLDFVGEIKAALGGIPILHAARIADVATARHAVASGKLDMVGMTRALIADPHIARKVAEGREQEIRPCVGATYCLDRIYEGGEALCIHNAATGREATMPHIVPRATGPKRRVVVVGAGPAGLEAARVSAERGHEVVLYEAQDEAGGQIRLAARQLRRRELLGIVDWRLQRLEKLGVAMRFNKWAEAADVLADNPDIVVIATGGLPNAPALEAGTELTVSSWDILSGDAKPAKEVLLFDDNGAHPGLQAAEMIAEAGAKLEIVTPERFFAPEVGGLNHVPYAECFQQHGVRITIARRLKAVRRAGNRLEAVIGSDYGDWTETREVDQVVVEHGTLPNADLYEALKAGSVNEGAVDYRALIAGRPQEIVRNPAGSYRLIRIGDAVSSRNIHAAIYDALRFAKDF
jgi:2,4-dienoyl-CoA reductase-like NADH-dependent reductase (Old Yellow Enzyme family)